MLKQFAQNLKTREFWIDTTRWINFVLTIRLKKHQKRTLDIRDMFRQEVLNQQSLSSKKIEKETIAIDYTAEFFFFFFFFFFYFLITEKNEDFPVINQLKHI